MITQGSLEQLSGFNAAPLLVTSLYLNVDPRRFPKPSVEILLKDLVRDRLGELREAGLSHDQLKSVEGDMERLSDFLSGHNFAKTTHKGLALFSCAGKDFFQVHHLPHGFKATLVSGPTPYLRPLTALLAQSPRALALIVDQRQARAFVIHGGEVHDAFEIANDTPQKLKKGGAAGKEERHIEHHHDEVVHQHYQQIADRMLQMFKSAPFDHVILGGHLDELRDFERHLHSYLSERVIGRFRTDIKSTAREEVLARASEVMKTEEAAREHDAVQRVIGASRTNGGLAVTGLRNSLAALNDRRIQTLLVSPDLVTPGRRCAACETLFLEEAKCSRCGGATAEVADVIAEAIALTVDQGGAIRILSAGTPLAANGQMGAMLRY